MSEWWTYSLSDFLLFSPRTYYRLIELYNEAIWPLQLVAVASGVLVVVSLWRRPHANRLAPLLLASVWAWTAWAFHFERYAQINWAAPWFAIAFTVQALLLSAIAFARNGISVRSTERPTRVAMLVALLIVVAYPMLAPLSGRGWETSEVFGVAPDPTALATLTLMVTARGRRRWLLCAIPGAWCAIAFATLAAMDSAQAYVVLAFGLVALGLGASLWPNR